MLKFTEPPKTLGVTLKKPVKKDMAFPEGNKLIWFNLQRDGTGKGFSDIKDTFAESLRLQMSVLHQSMCIFKTGLSSSYDCWAKYKEKVPDVSDPN